MEMDGFEIVEKSILELRVVELKDILEYIGLDTEGAKKVLQDRLIQAAEKDVFRFKSYVLQMKGTRLLSKSRRFHHPEDKSTIRARSMFLMDCLGQYDFHSDVQVTTALLPDTQKNKLVLQLSPYCVINLKLTDVQKELIFGSSSGIPNSRAKIFLRFGIDQEKLMIEDSFPKGINVAVNGRQISLPEIIPSKPNEFCKRFPKPVDITEYLREDLKNSVSILWHQSEDLPHLVSIFCAVKVDTEDLLMRIRRRPTPETIPIETLIRNFFKSDEEFLTIDKCIVSLKCPLVRNRIKYPSRGRCCSHIQCFDAENYLQMNIRRPKWNCPVCGLRTYFYDLNIDAFTENILQSKNLSSTTDSVKIDRHGNWTENVIIEPESSTLKTTNTKEQEVITLDSDDEDPSPAKLSRIHQSFEKDQFVSAPRQLQLSPSWSHLSSDVDDIITID